MHDEYCKICSAELEWEDCPDCGGDGYFDEYDDDPINFSPGERLVFCSLCDGVGGFLCCPNAEYHKGISWNTNLTKTISK